jgi:small nuclear ribonucleoprotein G
MDRKIFLHVQGGRSVSGVLRGFDIFLNLVLDQAVEEQGGGQKRNCGMIVSASLYRYAAGTLQGNGRVDQDEAEKEDGVDTKKEMGDFAGLKLIFRLSVVTR